ncbi:MAG: glucosaminidase domain-containing protein [Candidatus Pacebacteria bacterium]|nr:glucosaminidase domain-containing protein [Candidatus Paceibacterota bacterium]
MKKQKIINYLQSIIAIPMFAIAMPLSGISAIPSMTAINNIPKDENSVIIAQEEVVRKEKAEKIDALLAKYDSPLEGHGMKFVTEAEKHDLDWRLLVAISGRESTFGRHACKKVTNSFLGYGSCKINYKSTDEAIEKVSASLGGNNAKTAHYYKDKTTTQILRKYNTVIPNYPKEVIKIMKMISDEEVDII